MKINKLILSKFKRVFLAHRDKIVYTPQSKMQIILGTNGSGKSQLLKELTPLPANIKQDYKEGGYKYLEISHNGRFYIISSGLIANNKHSFKVDGEELNMSGTKQIQTELVLQHFKITNEIHNLNLGNITFTKMSLADRKKWFTEISEIDYTYAINVYNKLRKRHRDIVGGVKILEAKISREKLNIVDEKTLEVVKNDKAKLREMVDHLLTLKGPVKDQSIITDIDRLNNILDKSLTRISKFDIDKSKDVNSIIYNLEHIVVEKNKRIAKIKTDLDKLEQLKSNNLENTSIEKISDDISNLKAQIISIDMKNVYSLDLLKIEHIQHDYMSLEPDVINIVNSISDIDVASYDSDTIVKHEDTISKLNVILNTLDTRISKLDIEIKTVEAAMNDSHVTCGKCGHEWFNNIDIKRLDNNKLELKDLLIRKDKVKEEIDKLTEECGRIYKISDLIKQLSNLGKYGSMVNIWNEFVNKVVMAFDINNASMLLNNYYDYGRYLDKLLPYNKLTKEISVLENKLQILQATSDMEKTLKDKELNTLETMLADELSDLNVKTKELEEYKQYKIAMDNVVETQNALKTVLKQSRKNVDIDISNLKNEYIDKLISSFKDMINDKENIIYKSNINMNILLNTQKELNTLKDEEKVLKSMVVAMSPNEGLIAKSISSFLTKFVRELNKIINNVWEYSMEVQICQIEDGGDLNYKFPVLVDGRELIEDVSKTSASMQEIVDLAFKLVCMRFLGLDTYPIVADEFGRTMDNEHRIKAFDALDKLAESNFSQIFIVSHFETLYGRFRNADINVISDRNLSLDKNLATNINFKVK
jgi:enamine deaminase RidA (YjgF/YER057c/UK114 family)